MFSFWGSMFAELSWLSFSEAIPDASAVNAVGNTQQSRRNTTRFLKLIIVAWMKPAW
jgi:hypothetical protein